MTALKLFKHTFFSILLAAVLLTIAILSLFANCFETAKASALESYLWARVTTDNVNLYATEHSAKVICELEKSYYLKILNTNGNMLFVSVMQNETDFPEICGYVYKDDVELSTVEPLSPIYPTEKVTVSADSASLKLTPTPNAETVVTATNTQQLAYYGKTSSYGKTWYYVYYAGKFGYVEANSVTTPKISLHPTPLVKDVPTTTTPVDNNPPQETPPEQSVSPTAEILLIVFVALLAVGLTLSLFLPGNIKKRSNVFDQDI